MQQRRFDPELDHRRSIRLRNHDYVRGAVIFVTICTFQREPIFGEVSGSQLRLNAAGDAIVRAWESLPLHFPAVSLDAFVIMPNHLHGILCFGGTRPGGSGARLGLQSGSLGAVIGSFKSAASRRANLVRETPGMSVWQRNYYEHVVSDSEELARIRSYIAANPATWAEDEFYRPTHPRIP